jgi:hypothetical protein
MATKCAARGMRPERRGVHAASAQRKKQLPRP